MKTVYDEVADKYHQDIEDHENFYNQMLEMPSTLAVLKELSLKDKKVLDLGCGGGRYTKFFLMKLLLIL